MHTHTHTARQNNKSRLLFVSVYDRARIWVWLEWLKLNTHKRLRSKHSLFGQNKTMSPQSSRYLIEFVQVNAFIWLFLMDCNDYNKMSIHNLTKSIIMFFSPDLLILTFIQSHNCVSNLTNLNFYLGQYYKLYGIHTWHAGRLMHGIYAKASLWWPWPRCKITVGWQRIGKQSA